MHRSRLAGICIDCETDDLESAAEFWSAALGYPCKTDNHYQNYKTLVSPESEIGIEVQQVTHPSRVHLDIESDDVEAEVQRLDVEVASGAEELGQDRRVGLLLEHARAHRHGVARHGDAEDALRRTARHVGAADALVVRAEEDAREAKRGLWADTEPVPPWEWRRTRAR